MTNRAQMLILGLLLLLLSVIWSWFVIETIPAGYGDGEIGARIFPLTFGLSLLALSLLLLVKEFLFFKNHSSTIGIFKQLKITPFSGLYVLYYAYTLNGLKNKCLFLPLDS